MNRNFREKLISGLIVGSFILAALEIYSFITNSTSTNSKKINFNNKYYLVKENIGMLNTYYHITLPPTNLDVPPRPGALFEYYIGKKTDDGVVLYSYGKFNNDTLEAQVEHENDPEFEARQDTLEMLFGEYQKNGRTN